MLDVTNPPSPSPRGWVTSFGIGRDGNTSPAGLDCGDVCSANFAAGTVVTLWAISFEGSIFQGWLGTGRDGRRCAERLPHAPSPSIRRSTSRLASTTTRVPSNSRPRSRWPEKGRVPAPSRAGRRGIECGSRCVSDYPSNMNLTLIRNAHGRCDVRRVDGRCMRGRRHSPHLRRHDRPSVARDRQV